MRLAMVALLFGTRTKIDGLFRILNFPDGLLDRYNV